MQCINLEDHLEFKDPPPPRKESKTKQFIKPQYARKVCNLLLLICLKSAYVLLRLQYSCLPGVWMHVCFTTHGSL